MRAGQKTFGVNENALAAVLRLTHRNEIAFLEAPRLDRLQSIAPLDHHAIHARADGHEPAGADLEVGRQVRGRKEPLRQHSVRGQRLEARRRDAGKRRFGEVGR